ncbi:MAG: YceI family protein [Marinilabiliaceae bacterium]|nr:YceI family protein [Marinilabiliaceae bacterium]
MKKRTFPILIAVLVFVSGTLVAQNKAVDVTTSKITWTGKKVTGEHMGHIHFKSGQLLFNGAELSGGEFIVDMTTITCTDLKDKEYNKKLVGHLKSDDFFGVSKFTESMLKLTSVKKSGNGYDVKGDLTIKGKTNPIAFKATSAGNKFMGTMVIDRTVYDVRYGSGKFFDNLGDKMIYDEFELVFEVKTK